MLEKMRAAGKPVDARMQKMADWMDSMEPDEGMVRCDSILSAVSCKLARILLCRWWAPWQLGAVLE